MKSQLNKILKITLIILLFSFSKSYSIEDVSEFTDAIDEVREEFNNISEASTEQSKIIDEALKEIDKATEYVQEAINNDNAEDAIKTLDFIEKSLTDVESIIPQEFGSDMSNIDTSAFAKEDMDIVNEVTAQMKTVKEEKLKDFMADLVDLNQKGMQAPQQFGSASSYAKKYALGNLFLIDDTQDSDATNNHGKDKLTDISKAKSYIKSGGKIEAIKAKYQLTSAQEAELKTL